MSIELTTRRGAELLSVLADLARLRIEVFREWPYLYDGNLSYEESYLSHMAESPDAFCVLAIEAGKIVGASTAGVLESQDADFRQPLEQAGYSARECLYCGESVLSANYRGRGLGHRFFDLREQYGRELGRRFSTFCRVLRPQDHPLKPAEARPLDDFWQARGYAPVKGVRAQFSWKDLDLEQETSHPMEFWLRSL